MGFGQKTDYATGRVLDLDKSYKNIIKPAAEAAGVECVRADEIVHSGTIDVPMYERLLTADVVVADVSTSNCNAFYELGVRHALKPYTTITIAEEKIVFPFDISHISVRKYRHLGEDIGFDETMRMRNELENAIRIIAAKPVNDSPVYEFLKDLNPPMRTVAEKMTMAEAVTGDQSTVSALMAEADNSLKGGDFVEAISLLKLARKKTGSDAFVTQKLALATYKSKLPDPLTALENAKNILSELHPGNSTDPETLGLWGAIHKRKWELTGDPANLDIAIHSYGKGFYLKNDYYNGINLAFLLNRRAERSGVADAIADFVLAQRIRRQVLAICQDLLDSRRTLPDEYWLRATMAEAWLGVGERDKSREALDAAFQMKSPPADWMKASTRDQLESLGKLLENSPLGQIKA